MLSNHDRGVAHTCDLALSGLIMQEMELKKPEPPGLSSPGFDQQNPQVYR